MVIGITGTDGSGKGTVVEYLVNTYGFVHYSARKILIIELEKEGRGTTRVDLRLKGNELREQFGDDFVVSYNLKKIQEEKTDRAIIESIRTTAEADTLQKNEGVLIAVDADQKIRYERVQERRSESDKVTFEEFVNHEKLEQDDPEPHGMQKAKVMEMAAYTILNNGSIDELHQEVDALMKKLQIA